MDTVDYVKPADVAMAMVETGRRKLGLAPRDLLIRGMLSGAILDTSGAVAVVIKSLVFPASSGVGKDWGAAPHVLAADAAC